MNIDQKLLIRLKLTIEVIWLENEDDRTSYSKYYTPSTEKKEFNVLIDGKSSFEVPIKNKEKTYEVNIEMSKNSDYITGKLLDYEYYKLIAIDLSKQIKLENPDLKQQINFIGKLEDKARMFFIIDKSEEATFKFLQNSVSIV